MGRGSQFVPLTVEIPDKSAFKLRDGCRILEGRQVGSHGLHPSSLPAVTGYSTYTAVPLPVEPEAMGCPPLPSFSPCQSNREFAHSTGWRLADFS